MAKNQGKIVLLNEELDEKRVYYTKDGKREALVLGPKGTPAERVDITSDDFDRIAPEGSPALRKLSTWAREGAIRQIAA